MRRIKALFTENLGTKVMAAFMACALWTYAYYFSLQNEVQTEIPIEVRVPDGWSVMERNPSVLAQVSITYPTHAGDRVQDAIDRKEFRLVFKPQVSPDETLKPIEARVQAKDFNIPPGTEIRVTDWSPKSVSFSIAKRGTVQLPVKLDVSDPPPGYRIQSPPWFSPQRVDVQGPAGALERAESIETKRITLTPPPLGQPRQQSIGLKSYVVVDGRKYDVDAPQEVDYVVYLAQELKERTFEKVPVDVAHRPDYPNKVKLKTREVDVIVRGPEGALAELTAANIKLSVNVNELSPQSMPYLVDIHSQLDDVADASQFEIELKQSRLGVDIQPATTP